MVTHQLQVERRTGKVRRPETDVLPLCHATNLSEECNNVNKDIRRLKVWSTSSSCYELRTVTDRGAEWQQHTNLSTLYNSVARGEYSISTKTARLCNGNNVDYKINDELFPQSTRAQYVSATSWTFCIYSSSSRRQRKHLCNDCLICQLARCRIRYDTRCYFNVRSKADISQLNLPHGTDN